MYFHEEEELTFAVLSCYEKSHPNTHYIMEFAEGDVYECVYLTDSEDDNDEDLDSPDYDEFWTAYYTVLKIIKPGPNHDPSMSGSIDINYRHFPTRITTADGAVVYPEANS